MKGRSLWVFTEQRNGRLQAVCLELLGKGRDLADRLGAELAAILFGDQVAALVQPLISHGADKVYLAESPQLATYCSDPYTHLLTELIGRHEPDIVLLGATAIGRDLAPSVAARLSTGLSADCVGLDIGQDGLLLQMVPVLGRKGMAVIVCPHQRPQMATVRPGVMRQLPPRERKGVLERVEVRIPCHRIRTQVRGFCPQERPSAPIEQVSVIVAGGAGINSQEGWDLLGQLAKLLGGELGGTRPPMDHGWITEDRMIGQSGKTVRPKLYIGVAISGDMQHTVSITEARFVVAINNDPKARIFQEADFGIVGDYREIVPCLIRELGG